MIETKEISFNTTGPGDVVDITPDLRSILGTSKISSGTITVFVPGSTGGLTTVEFEPGLRKDLPEFFERIIPSNNVYHHDETWHDGNGFSHVRAALVGPDITVPFVSRQLTLGTWQQVVFLEFDNRSRNRRLVVQMMGE